MKSKYDFIVLGGTGQQGQICARDLIELGYSIVLAGRNKDAVKNLLKNKNVDFIYVDLNNIDNVVSAIKKSNPAVVINCAELTYNVNVMKACLKTKKPLTDLGGLQKITLEQFKLHDDFKKAGIINITGCGSTPGIANIITAHVLEKYDSADTIELGFAWNSNIKKFVVPYSMHSIFDELTQEPVTYHNGKFVNENRLVCTGTYDFKEVGKQTTYCIVHSEVYTFSKYFKNKGLKNIHYMAGFPEHSFNVIKTLINLGFNSKDPVEISGIKIKPVDFTDKVLSKIKMPGGYKEIENIWVRVYGKINGEDTKSEINCIVKTLKGWEDAGSNIDTGRTISIISQMLKKGLIRQTGVFGPEAVVPHREFIKELGKREMYVYENGRKIN